MLIYIVMNPYIYYIYIYIPIIQLLFEFYISILCLFNKLNDSGGKGVVADDVVVPVLFND